MKIAFALSRKDSMTPQEILDLAAQMEERGKAFYATAAEVVEHPGARQLLKELAEEEVAHLALFRDLAEREDYASLAKGRPPEDLRLADYLVATDIGPNSTPQDILVVAIKLEDAAVKLYSQWLEIYRGTAVQTLLEGLVQEEQRHKARLEALYHDLFLEDW